MNADDLNRQPLMRAMTFVDERASAVLGVDADDDTVLGGFHDDPASATRLLANGTSLNPEVLDVAARILTTRTLETISAAGRTLAPAVLHGELLYAILAGYHAHRLTLSDTRDTRGQA